MSADANLESLEAELLGEINASSDLKVLDDVRVSAIGKRVGFRR